MTNFFWSFAILYLGSATCVFGNVVECNTTNIISLSADEHVTIQSPGYPGDYPDGVSICWHIETTEEVISSYMIDQHTESNYDLYRVYEVHGWDITLVEELSGDYISPDISTYHSSYIVISFTSDSSITYRGFQACIFPADFNGYYHACGEPIFNDNYYNNYNNYNDYDSRPSGRARPVSWKVILGVVFSALSTVSILLYGGYRLCFRNKRNQVEPQTGIPMIPLNATYSYYIPQTDVGQPGAPPYPQMFIGPQAAQPQSQMEIGQPNASPHLQKYMCIGQPTASPQEQTGIGQPTASPQPQVEFGQPRASPQAQIPIQVMMHASQPAQDQTVPSPPSFGTLYPGKKGKMSMLTKQQ